jgi:biopolymer transport protein ExbB
MNFVFHQIDKGGILIYPLMLLLIWGILIIVVKLVTLRKDRIINPGVIQKVEEFLLQKKIPEATAYCKQNPLPMTRILLEGVVNYERSEPELKEILEEAGRQELPGIRRHLTALGTIAGAAPLLGLLGTVLGMISVFAALSQESDVNPATLAGGISEALITTAVGLVIATPTLIFYNFFTGKIQNLIIEMEKISLRLVAVLKRTR